MDKNQLYSLGIVCMVIGTMLNMLGVVYGFIFWMISNPIFLYKAITEKDRVWTIVFVIMFASAIFGFVWWSFIGGVIR